MNLFNVCSGFKWDSDSHFQFYSSSEEYSLLVEYLNIFKDSQDLSLEYCRLLSFKNILKETSDAVEQFVMNELFGFIEIDSSIYAFIGGSMDFTVRLLFDLDHKVTWIQPIYGGITWFKIELDELMNILSSTIQMFKIIGFPS